MTDFDIRQATDTDIQTLEALTQESCAEGFAFVRRLVDDWESGANRFDKPGEALLVARREGIVVGVCGLNADPYCRNPAIGRVRHLYVLREHRRHGYGWALVQRIITKAAKSFRTLTLRTDSPEAAAFYSAIGFLPTSARASSTHSMDLVAHKHI